MSLRAMRCIAMLALPVVAFAQDAKPAPARQAGGPDAVFAAWDKDGNGTLSKDEFRNGWAGTRNALATQRLKAEFQRHDANKDGSLQAGEYANLALVQRAGKSAPMMSAFDRNKDQGLDFAEYVDFVKTAAQLQPAAPVPAKTK